jgi:hypothetical protein
VRIVRLIDRPSLEALYRSRRRIYVDELGWLKEQGGLLCDEFDDCADNYAAYDDSGEVIGSVRVVPDGPMEPTVVDSRSIDNRTNGRTPTTSYHVDSMRGRSGWQCRAGTHSVL